MLSTVKLHRLRDFPHLGSVMLLECHLLTSTLNIPAQFLFVNLFISSDTPAKTKQALFEDNTDLDNGDRSCNFLLHQKGEDISVFQLEVFRNSSNV